MTKYINNLLFFFCREKQDGQSSLTTTARTLRETAHFGKRLILCPGRTGADGAPGSRGREAQPPALRKKGTAAEEEMLGSDRRVRRSAG